MKLSLVNSLSIIRFFLAPLFFYLFLTGSRLPAIIVAVIILLSDFLDGYLARKLNKVTPLGGTLDAIADKLFITLGLAAFLITQSLTIVQALLAFSKDILVVLSIAVLGVKEKRKVTSFKSASFGKAIAVLQYALIVAILLGLDYNWPLIIVILILLPFALVQYARIYKG